MTSTTNKPKLTVLLASIAIASVIGAITTSHFAKVTNLEEINIEEILANKTPVRYKLSEKSGEELGEELGEGLDKKSSNIKQLSVQLPKELYGLTVNIDFKEQSYIEVNQPIDDDDHYYRYFSNIDLNQLNWQLDNGILTMDLSKSMDDDSVYYDTKLQISLPKQDWKIDFPAQVSSLYVDNTAEPINLTFLARGAEFTGNYAKLAIIQTGVDDCNGSCFSFRNTVTDSLYASVEEKALQDMKVEMGSNYDGESPFSIRLKGIQANRIDLNVPKNSNVDVYDLSLLDKIIWHDMAITDTESAVEVETKTMDLKQ